MTKALPSTPVQTPEIDFHHILQDIVEQPVVVADLKGNVLVWNYGAQKAYGWTEKEMVGKSILDILEKPSFADEADLILKIMQKRDSWTHQLVIHCKDHSSVRAKATAAPLFINNKLTAIVGIIVDLSEIEYHQKQLQTSEAKYMKLFNTMSQGVIYQDPQNQITNANPAAEKILGMKLSELKGPYSIDNDWAVIHENNTPFAETDFPAYQALLTKQQVNNVVMGIFQPKKKEYHWILASSVPEFEADQKQVKGVYTVFTDITEQKKAEQKLKDKSAEFQEMNQYMIDREIRMTQLKEENQRLKKELAKYIDAQDS